MRDAAQGFAIDLGSATLRILSRQEQQVLRTPTVAALDHNGRIWARGNGALALQGRRPDALRLVRPVTRRAVADTTLAAHLLRVALREASGGTKSRTFSGGTVCVPDRIGALQTQALLDVCENAGLRRIRLVPKSLAAAAGSGVPLAEPAGALIVDVGAERTSASLLSFGDVIAARSAAVGGTDVDTGLIRLMRHRHGLTICPGEAERAKHLMTRAAAEHGTVPVHGQDLQRGLPDTRQVPVAELAQVARATYGTISDLVLALLPDSPPKLVEDVYDRGLILCGEAAHLHGLPDHLRDRTGLPVHVPDQPGDVGVRGAWQVRDPG
ncbi:rod shape-determining protein [Streptomyces monticola]|uniref:Rod shape-determining protein n=1 Tax=Streptomyces monticola TaxID=2666263 RepID=A0ABW2JS25_9ACTN